MIKRTVSTLLFLFSFFHMQAQSIKDMIEGLTYGQRLDTLISISSDKELGYIPLAILKGSNRGPVYTIVAGIHGSEYPPIIAMQELMKEIDIKKLHGTLIILPITNIASFYGRTPFVNPIDNKNLNTIFPGSKTGSISEKIAQWITQDIISISDVFIDIHGGDANEDLLPFVCYYDNQDEQTEKARLLSEASDIAHIVSYPYNLSNLEPAKYALKQAVQDGVVALSLEAGKLGNVDLEDVFLLKNAVYNILRYSGMYSSKVEASQKQKIHLRNQSYVVVPENGLFYSSIKSGDTVFKGQDIGYITDSFGKILHQITAPVSGLVLYKIGTPPVRKSETLFCIGY